MKAENRGRRRRRSWKRSFGRFGLGVLAVFVVMVFTEEVLTRVFPFPEERLPSRAVVEQSTSALGALPPTLVSTLLLAEDRRFWSHRGVDAWALLRSGVQRLLHRDRTVTEAQTISMRLVRDLLPSGESGFDQLVRMFRARQLERLLEKREILSEFCARARFGRSVRGFKAAARRWFDVEPSALRPEQAATLVAALLPNVDGPQLKRRRDRLLRSLCRRGLLRLDRYRAAIAKPLCVRGCIDSPESEFLTAR